MAFDLQSVGSFPILHLQQYKKGWKNHYWKEICHIFSEVSFVLLNGYTLAATDEKGNFSLQLKSGTYALTVRYAYGFSRTLYVVVSDRDLQCGSVPVIGCDWNKDGKIDDQDYYMFKLIFGTHQGQAGYLSYVDMNHDGMINTRDMIFVERCMGLQAGSFAYTPLVIR